MNNRPKVYGFCDAGCKWRVPHYDEFASAAALLPIDVSTSSGVLLLEAKDLHNTYKLEGGAWSGYDEQDAWTFAIKVYNAGGDEITLPLPAYDKYSDGMRFRLLDYIIGEGYTDTEGTYHEPLNILYECNGQRYTHTLDSDIPWTEFINCVITGLMEAYIVNTDATFTVLAQDGEDGANVESLELIGQDENGGNIYRQTYSDGSTFDFVAPKGLTGEKGDGAQEVYDTLLDKEETGEYEDVEIAALPVEAFSLRTGGKGDTALIEVVPSGTYVLSFDSCIQFNGLGSLYWNEYTEGEEQVVTDEVIYFNRLGETTGEPTYYILNNTAFPNGGNVTITVGATTKYIKIMFDAWLGAPERLPAGLTLFYQTPVFGYGKIKPEKLPTKVVSNNLFNKNTATTGKNVYLGKNSSGEPLYGWFCNIYNVVATEASASGFDSTSTAIEIEGGQTYYKTVNTIIHFFDKEDIWINHPRPTFNAEAIVAPENAKYVRIGFKSPAINTLQFVKGDKALPYDEWRMGIENFGLDKTPQIDEVLVRNGLQHSFMQEYMWDIAEEAHKYTAPDRHTFIFVSDTHATTVSDRIMAIVANMTKYVPCSCVVHGGDIINGVTPKANELLLLTTLVRNGNEAKCPVYYVKGNHDWNLLYRTHTNTSATADEYILNSELARRTNCFNMQGVHGDVKNMYFYVDDENTKTRTIIVNCVNKDESGDLSALNNNSQVFGAAQVEWLINEALNFKEIEDKKEWGVIVIQHQSSTTGIWSVLNGFKNGTNGTAVGANGENLSIPFDFTEQGAMNLIANFVGDIHYDGVTKNGTTPIIYMLNASLANDYANTEVPTSTALKPPDKVIGTENETAFDIVTIDKANHLIYLTRFGARSYAYNSATGAYDKIAARTRVVDYSTGICTVITEE